MSKKIDIKKIVTLGDLKKSGYKSKSIKDEVRDNLIASIQNKENASEGILGHEDTVIPDVERALLSRHNILFLGLRGQAKTRMARQMVDLLDEYIPTIAGSEVNDDPLQPLSRFAVDLIKAANLKLSFADEKVIHYGIIPRSNRCIFVINELPDLQARIQVSLFNILQEGDIQIRGFKLRMPLDILFVFTANPEDYTNRGSIVTPLKDRIESQILTHYPKTIETSLAITEQEANILPVQKEKVEVSDLIKRLIEQVSFEARTNEFVDKKSGVSARLTIAAYEAAVSSAERRAIIHGQSNTQVWISDLSGIIPAITGKIELVYEGEQEGPYEVALNLLNKSIRTLFVTYFPNPDDVKKRKAPKKSANAPEQKQPENPYAAIAKWFDSGNHLDLFLDMKDEDKMIELYKVDGLFGIVKKHFPQAGEKQAALLMEFVLHGLSSYSIISKKMIDGKIEFNDMMGSMINLGDMGMDDDAFNDYA